MAWRIKPRLLTPIYPQHHTGLARQIVATGGLLVSEYPLTYGGDKHTFPARNRIIAGLSQGVLVTECPRRSGAMITARFALDSGREVFALPGNVGLPNAEGPNYLLAQGAHLVQTGADISEVLKWPTTSTKEALNLAVNMPLFSPQQLQTDASPPDLTLGVTPDLPQDLLRVWQAMPPAGQAISVTALEGALAQTPPDPSGNNPQPLGVTLTLLALDGYIEQLPGQLVQRT
jgi:predicted Rossmann fold nucleotide-binding protein DprA/Smf involved in DNA uptake